MSLEELYRKQTINICQKKCLKSLSSPSYYIPELSCFERCAFKFSQAIKHVHNTTRQQDIEIAKYSKAQEELASQPSFWDKIAGVSNTQQKQQSK